MPLEIRHLYSKESSRLHLLAEGLQQPVQMLSMLLRYARTFSPVARPYVFWNYFQTTLSCTAGVIWLGIGVIPSFPTITFWLAYANFKWKRMMLAPVKIQQFVATTSLRKALVLQATQWHVKYGTSSHLTFSITASSYKTRGRKRSTAPAKQEEEPLMLTSFKARALSLAWWHKHHLMGNDSTPNAATFDSSHHRTSGQKKSTFTNTSAELHIKMRSPLTIQRCLMTSVTIHL